MIYTTYSKEQQYQIFEKTRVGFEFEFFTDLPEKEIVKIFKNALKKKIVLGSGRTYIKGKNIGYHTQTPVDETTFKLEKDYSGGPMMYELVTGHLPYYEAKKVMLIILKTIHQIGWTNDNSSLHINISFTDPSCQIMFINILKFCLNFYSIEKEIFLDFPSRKNNIYTESITRILPDISSLTFSPTEFRIDNVKVKLPTDSRYFGVNFSKMTKDNFLEYRYIGGRGYVKKQEEIAKYLDKFVLYSYSMSKDNNITPEDTKKFQALMNAYYQRMKHFEDYLTFEKKFNSKIEIFVDLKSDPEFLQIKYPEIKMFLYDLIVNNGFREGYINYDSEVHRFQVKDAEVKKGILLKDIDFIDCKISGNFENCEFVGCEIDNSMIFGGSLIDCEITHSKVIDVYSDINTIFDECFIRNDRQQISGEFKKSIIIGTEARLLSGSEWDDSTLFVHNEYGSKKKK